MNKAHKSYNSSNAVPLSINKQLIRGTIAPIIISQGASKYYSGQSTTLRPPPSRSKPLHGSKPRLATATYQVNVKTPESRCDFYIHACAVARQPYGYPKSRRSCKGYIDWYNHSLSLHIANLTRLPDEHSTSTTPQFQKLTSSRDQEIYHTPKCLSETFLRRRKRLSSSAMRHHHLQLQSSSLRLSRSCDPTRTRKK